MREPRARATPARRSLSLSLSLSQLQPRELYELSNEALALGARDNEAHDLHQERLIRDIMVRRARCVFSPLCQSPSRRDAPPPPPPRARHQGRDNLEYDAARERMKEVFRTNYQASAMYELPPFVGLVVSGVAAVVCVPLVFDLETASWFA